MEKAPGIPLSEVWESLHSRKKFEIIQQLVQFEASFAAEFPAYGSLYYSHDLPTKTPAIQLPAVKASQKRFSIGPTNNRKCFDDGRDRLHLDRGPCKRYFIFLIQNTSDLSLISLRAHIGTVRNSERGKRTDFYSRDQADSTKARPLRRPWSISPFKYHQTTSLGRLPQNLSLHLAQGCFSSRSSFMAPRSPHEQYFCRPARAHSHYMHH